MICPNCSHENRSGARFCADCGTSLVMPATPGSLEPTVPPAIRSLADDMAFSSPAGEPSAQDVMLDVGAQPWRAAPAAAGDERAPAQETGPSDLDLESPAGATEQAGGHLVENAEINHWPFPAPDAVPLADSSAAPVAAPAATPLAVFDALPENREDAVFEPAFAGAEEDGELAASVTTAGADSVELSPLQAGALIASRFLVLTASEEPEGRVYEVQDRGMCAFCGSAVTASTEEPYCFECGAYLLDENAQFPRRRLIQLLEIGAENSSLDGVFAWQGMTFALAAPGPGAPSDAVAATGGVHAPDPSFTRGVTLMAAQRSDRGIARAETADEDSIFSLTVTSVFESLAQPALGLYLVADGMGGHGDGEIASRIAVETVSTALLQTVVIPVLQGQAIGQETIDALLNSAIAAANRRVYENARARGNDMGTTLTLALVIDDQAYIANVGDSRTYLWRQGELQQITEDHSAVYQLVRKGVLQPEEIYTHPQRNQITRSLGIRNDVRVDCFHQQLSPHDALLLCCDGLWEMLHNDGIADVLLSHFGDIQTVCNALVRRANQAGGEDNISVVLVRVEP